MIKVDKKVRVLFVYTNINGFHEDTYSFGLASIVSITRHNGYEAKVLLIQDESEYSNVIKEIENFGPQVVGFTSVSSQFDYVKKIASLVKAKYPQIITVCGGVHPTINSECLLETEDLDGIFIGESEFSFVEFLNKVENGESFQETDNFYYKKEGSLVINKLKPLLSDLDVLPYEDRDIYPALDTINAVGYIPFMFSRGCPYLCSYCSNHAIAKKYNLPRNSTRYRSPESSIREIEEVLKKFSIDKLLFVDDIFGLNMQWRKEFCREYKKRVNKKFQCLLRANLVTEEFIKILKEAGCYRVSIGVESGNDYVRNTIMNRCMSDEQIINAFDLAHKYGLETNSINIIGVPGETEDMIWDTVRLNRKVKPTTSGVNIFYPYKGTKLGDSCFEKGLVDIEAYSTFSNERRESILNYPPDYKKRLSWFHKNWERLVYPFDMKRSFLRFARNTPIWGILRKIKKYLSKT